VARGDPIWVEVSLNECRLGRTWTPSLIGIEKSRRIAGVESANQAVAGFMIHGRGPASSGSLLRIDPLLSTSLTAGSQALDVTYDVQIGDFHGQHMPEVTTRVETKFVLRDGPPPTVQLERNDAAFHQILTDAAVGQRAVTRARYYASGNLSFSVQMVAPPSYDLAYEIFARLPDGTERKVGSYTAKRGAQPGIRCAGQIGRLDPKALTIDLVFRPSVEAALQTFDLTRLCAGEIVVEKVPLIRTYETPNPSEPYEMPRLRRRVEE
jgi:hypothetical protein